MRILAISDTHGYKIELPPADTYDVIVHSGDLMPNKTRGMLPVEAEWQTNWLRQNAMELEKWLGDGKKPVLVCSGNHDFVEPADVLFGLGWIRLSERLVEHEGVSFYGHSYTPYFTGEWHHEVDERQEMYCIEYTMPFIEQCNVLVSHGPLKGVLDRNAHGDRCGSFDLKQALVECKKLPQLMLHGHIHEAASRKPVDWNPHNKFGTGMKIYNSATIYNLIEI